MPIRVFTDALGVRWQVWSTVPLARGVADGFRDGWLTFDSANARRRLAPIPSDWEDSTVDDLRGYLSRASLVRSTPPHGLSPSDAEPEP